MGFMISKMENKGKKGRINDIYEPEKGKSKENGRINEIYEPQNGKARKSGRINKLYKPKKDETVQ